MNAMQPENKHPFLASYLPTIIAKAPLAEHQEGHRAHLVTVNGQPGTDEIVNGVVAEIPKIGVSLELRSTRDQLGWVYEGPLLTMECHGVPPTNSPRHLDESAAPPR